MSGDAVVLLDPPGRVAGPQPPGGPGCRRSRRTPSTRDYLDLPLPPPVPGRPGAPCPPGPGTGTSRGRVAVGRPGRRDRLAGGDSRPAATGPAARSARGLIRDMTRWRAADAARRASDDLLRSVTDDVPGRSCSSGSGRTGPGRPRSSAGASRPCWNGRPPSPRPPGRPATCSSCPRTARVQAAPWSSRADADLGLGRRVPGPHAPHGAAQAGPACGPCRLASRTAAPSGTG